MEKNCAYVNSAGAKIYYEVSGGGAPLLLLHGNGESLEVFAGQTGHFADKYRVVAVDSRGHGKSGYARPFTIEQMAKDALAVMDDLGIGTASVLGFSDGGNIALKMAILAPDRVTNLIAVGANLDTRGVKTGVQLAITAHYALLCVAAAFDKRAANKRDIIGLMVLEPNINRKELGGITARTLVMAGEKDMIRRRHTEEIAAGIYGSELRVLPGGDHFILFNRGEEANGAIMDFLLRDERRSPENIID